MIEPTQVEALLDEALPKSPSERAALLDHACEGNRELRQEVERLLAVHPHAEDFLGRPALHDTAAYGPLGEVSGTVIGPYKLLEQIGEGGMGTVWMAQQTEPVKRLVAIKLIKAGMDSKQVVARFESERQALALMDHTNIARVLDAGAASAGRPYFVMDLVKGVPITRYCDEHRLTPRQRLELFIPICQAVQHAHQKGIIHRDLKPSNVLVALYDGKPVPKVIDFGVAKATGQTLTEKTLVTGFGAIVGTLEYMSPEQAEINQLDIDTRSDIYSLGVLLYELLTGSTPFSRKEQEKAGMLEMLRVIREEEPTRPSTKLSTAEGLPTLAANRGTEPAKLTKLVRGELDWMVMKALEKDRSRRYETANGFAQDVQHYLADEPVMACPPSVSYRLSKFARRNKSKLAAATLLGLALLLAVSAIGWAVRDRTARAEEAKRAQAIRLERVAGQIQVILQEVARLQREQKWPEAMETARRASDLLTGNEIEAGIAAEVQDTMRDLELVRLVEDIRNGTSEWKESKFDYRGTAERYAVAFRAGGIDMARLTPEEATHRLRARPAVLSALVPALDDWAVCQNITGNGHGVQSIFNVADLVDPDPWRQKVRQALRTSDDKTLLTLAAAPDLARQPATTLTILGGALRIMNRVDAALGVLSLARQQHPSDFWVHFAMADTLNSKDPSSLEQAAGCYRTALGLRPGNAAAWNNLGIVLRRQGKLDEAIDCSNKAVVLDPKLANARVSLAKALFEQQRPDEAIASLNKAIELNPSLAIAHNNLGNALFRRGKADDAIACYHRAIELDPQYTAAHYNLGIVLAARQKLDEAIASYRKALELDPNYAEAHCNLGQAMGRQGKWDDAIACYHRAIELDPKNVIFHNSLGNALVAQRKLDEGIASYRKALELDPNYAEAHCNLGQVFSRQGKHDDALACHGKAIELDPKLALAHVKLGIILCDRKRDYVGAAAAFRKAIALQPDKPETHFNLGLALRLNGDTPGAITAFREASRLQPTDGAAHHNLARCLTTCADLKQRNPQEAQGAAKKAVELLPQSALAWLAMGWADYRVGDWKASIAALEKSMALQAAPKGGDAQQWFFLAMAHWQLGDQEAARKWYAQAVEWTDKHQPNNHELRHIRTEATELLGVGKQKD